MTTEKEWLASAGISIVKVSPKPEVKVGPKPEPFYMEFTESPGGPDGPLVDSVSATESNRCSWEPNPHGGEWEINGEGRWRIGPFYRSLIVAAPTWLALACDLAEAAKQYHKANVAYFNRINAETATAFVDAGEALVAALDAWEAGTS